MPVTTLLEASGRLLPKPGVRRSAKPLPVTAHDREILLRWIDRQGTAPRLIRRSVVVLLASTGWNDASIAAEIGVSRRTVALWKSRYRTGGVQAIRVDAPGRGRKRGRNAAVVARILAMTRQLPTDGERWTVRSMARAVGVSHATVQRVWREHGIDMTTAIVERYATPAPAGFSPSHSPSEGPVASGW